MKENELSIIEKLDVNNLSELVGWSEKQEALVLENPYVEITCNKSYDLASKSRTNLLKGRTDLEKQEKAIASKLTAFRKSVGDKTKDLISITLPHEEKQQVEVKRFEGIKEAEKLAKLRAEELRIETIKNKVSEFESNCNEIIQKTNIENVNENKSLLDSLFATDFDFEEYDILFEQAKNRVNSSWDIKCTDISEKENARKENDRLQKEKDDADIKLKAIQDQQEEERLERDKKDREEKENVFKIRENRLDEIGVYYFKDNERYFYKEQGIWSVHKESVFNSNAVEFETIFNDAKKAIKSCEESKSRQKAEKEAREKLEFEANKKAEQENKSRVKRLAKDKSIYENVLNENLSRFPIFFDSSQPEVKDFSINASSRVSDLLNQLLIELKEL